VTQQAHAGLPAQDDRATARCIAAGARQRHRDRVSDDSIGLRSRRWTRGKQRRRADARSNAGHERHRRTLQ
jgi:hypothetical protein